MEAIVRVRVQGKERYVSDYQLEFDKTSTRPVIRKLYSAKSRDKAMKMTMPTTVKVVTLLEITGYFCITEIL